MGSRSHEIGKASPVIPVGNEGEETAGLLQGIGATCHLRIFLGEFLRASDPRTMSPITPRCLIERLQITRLAHHLQRRRPLQRSLQAFEDSDGICENLV